MQQIFRIYRIQAPLAKPTIMKARIVLISAFVIPIVMASGQRPSMELIFTAIDSAAWIQLDSIKVINRTQGSETVLVYPDTVLMIDYVGVLENQDASEGFSIGSFPNPVADYTTVNVYIPGDEVVRISVTDLLGRQVIRNEQKLSEGTHTFSFTPGGENLYQIFAEWKGYNRTIKIINLSKSPGKTCSLTYSGYDGIKGQVKVLEAVQSFDYNPGDELLYIGYAKALQSGMLDVPETSEAYVFQFATNIPCPGTPTVTYDGQVYNTIQVFSQCWLKENLNVGTMIQGPEEMSDNGIVEKYCYCNMPDSCGKYGGLYQWNEMMQYQTQQDVQGICPTGWHIPTDEEWKVLEGAVDSQYGFGDQEWDIAWDYRGYDAGTNLKTTSGWYYGGNGTDLFGFSGLPGGSRDGSGRFGLIGYYGGWWTSMEGNYYGAWDRGLDYFSPEVYRYYSSKEDGYSVRCLRDN